MKHNLIKRFDKIQKGAVQSAIKHLKKDGKCLVVMTTGTGKTIVGCKIIKELNPKRTLWLTQTKELIHQTFQDLKQHLHTGNIGLYIRRNKRSDLPITVASLQTICKETNIKELSKNHFDLIVVDEVHHSMARTWKNTIKHFNTAKRLGLTATPERADGQDIKDLFGEFAFTLSYKEAQKAKIIAKEEVRLILTNSKIQGLVTRKQEYKTTEIDKLVVSENRNKIIVKSYKKYGRTLMKKEGLANKAICFCLNIEHAKRMVELFKKNGISAEFLGWQMRQGDRSSIYDQFVNSDKIEILCSVNILSEGKNIPNVGCLLLTRPTQSYTVFSQQLGRGCRRIEGVKEKYIILDYVDQIKNLRNVPTNFIRYKKGTATEDQIVLEYYRGKDPLSIDEIIKYVSSDYSNYNKNIIWNKASIKEAVISFYKKNGFVSSKYLHPKKTGLPARETVKRFYGTVRSFFSEIGVPYKGKGEGHTKEECIEKINKWYKNNHKISITQLGSKNNLPSQRTIYKYWGTWNKCLIDLGLLKHKWTKKKCIARGRAFLLKKEVDTIRHQDFHTKNNMPSMNIIEKFFSSIHDFRKALEIKPFSMATPFKGVWKTKHTCTNPYRSEIYYKGRRINLGTFKTAEQARDAYLGRKEDLKNEEAS